MATYAVESARQSMIATGIVNPVDEWEGEKGNRRRTGSQAKAADGTPVWSVEVNYVTESFNKQSTVTAGVTVPAAEPPAPAPYTPVEFAGLMAMVRVNFKSGQLIESWTAEGVVSFTPANKAPSAKPQHGDNKPSEPKAA